LQIAQLKSEVERKASLSFVGDKIGSMVNRLDSLEFQQKSNTQSSFDIKNEELAKISADFNFKFERLSQLYLDMKNELRSMATPEAALINIRRSIDDLHKLLEKCCAMDHINMLLDSKVDKSSIDRLLHSKAEKLTLESVSFCIYKLYTSYYISPLLSH